MLAELKIKPEDIDRCSVGYYPNAQGRFYFNVTFAGDDGRVTGNSFQEVMTNAATFNPHKYKAEKLAKLDAYAAKLRAEIEGTK